MKKLLTFIGAFTLTFMMFVLPSEAIRITNSPVSMTMAAESKEVVFTINDVEIYPSLYYAEDGNCAKKLEIWITENRIAENPEFLIYCYDKDGNHIDSEYITMKYDNRYSQYCGYVYADVNTASIEIQPAKPGSWFNSYYYCRYEGISADDGRKLAVLDLLVPDYEAVGWHGDVNLYALDGRELKVAYCDVAAYKAVGWYEWEDIKMIEFRDYFGKGINDWDYEGILEKVDTLKTIIKNPSYLQELSEAQCKAMDKWRVELNAPMALVDYHVLYNEKDGKEYLAIELRNVSYGTILSYKAGFVCHDNAGTMIKEENIYSSESTELNPGEKKIFYFQLDNYNTDYISNFTVRSVVFSDGTSWNG
ncbi:MAG: hypothetical protein IKL74_01190 [Clostridia bacterium]|nr:hypothetical protein [Clostridia bacterium]